MTKRSATWRTAPASPSSGTTYAGRPKIVAPEVLRHMLEALGLPCATRGDLLASRRLLQRRSTVQALPPLITATAGRPTRLDVGASEPRRRAAEPRNG